MLKLVIISHVNFQYIPSGRLSLNEFQGWDLVVLLDLIHGTNSELSLLQNYHWKKYIKYQYPPTVLKVTPVHDSWSM